MFKKIQIRIVRACNLTFQQRVSVPSSVGSVWPLSLSLPAVCKRWNHHRGKINCLPQYCSLAALYLSHSSVCVCVSGVCVVCLSLLVDMTLDWGGVIAGVVRMERSPCYGGSFLAGAGWKTRSHFRSRRSCVCCIGDVKRLGGEL